MVNVLSFISDILMLIILMNKEIFAHNKTRDFHLRRKMKQNDCMYKAIAIQLVQWVNDSVKIIYSCL